MILENIILLENMKEITISDVHTLQKHQGHIRDLWEVLSILIEKRENCTVILTQGE